MVNKFGKGKGGQLGRPFPFQLPVRRALLCAVLFLACLSAGAQSVDNRYSTFLCEGGITYFFRPQRLKLTEHIDGFTFDMTYHTSADSVIVNFTLLTGGPVNVNSVFLCNGESEDRFVGRGVSTLYCETRKSKYETRLTSVFSLTDIERAFAGEEPLRFEMVLDKGTRCSAVYGHSQWNKERRQASRILEMAVKSRAFTGKEQGLSVK